MTISCALPRVRAKFSSMTRAASRLLTSETKEFATHTGLQPPILRRIANNRDPIPLLPGEFRVFNQPNGQGTKAPVFSALVCGQCHIGTPRFAAQQNH